MKLPDIRLYLIPVLLSFALYSTGSASDTGRGIVPRSILTKDSNVKVGTYHALIIGINDYKDTRVPDLKTAVNDAETISGVLKELYGFTDVTLLLNENASSSKIIRHLRRLSTQSQKNDSVMIYYAGHGELDKITGSGWWIPYDATLQDPATYIDNSVIQKYIKAIPARHVLLLSDSCFSGTLFGEARSLPPVIDDKFYASLFKERSRWGMTSGNLTPVADSGSGGHSIFAYHLLKTLKQNKKFFLTPREIYAQIGPVIRNNSEQMPLTKPIRNTGDEGGEFIFIRTASLDSATAIPASTTGGMPYPAVSATVIPLPVPSTGKAIISAPKKKLIYASLEIETKPMGADIYVDDQHVGDTTGGSLVWDRFPMGEYTIKAQKKGYKEKVTRLRIKPESNTLIMNMDSDSALPAEKTVVADGMIFIKGGCYQMGDTFGIGKRDEKPVHEVCVNDYWIGEHEVTQGEWTEIMRRNPSKFRKCGSNCPVESVTWDLVQKFIKRLNRKKGTNYRLPTEAEWEYAARERGKKVKFGTGTDTIDPNQANYKSRRGTRPVKSFAPNSLGLYDMSGNVWEWCSDIYSEYFYRESPRDNPVGKGRRRVQAIRGGSWRNRKGDQRATRRQRYNSDIDRAFLGFRLARTP